MAMLMRKNRLAFWRQVRGYTQDDVALWVGVNRATIVSWERDYTEPKAAQAQRLATLLGVTVRQLFPHRIY